MTPASPSSYGSERLAKVYDALNPPSAEEASFFIELAGQPKTVLDVGCGTGALACQLAELGHRVTGIDPSAAMLSVARARDPQGHVTWIESTAADLMLATRFDLILMSGHVFQVFLSDRDILAALQTLAAHLAPAGHMAFATRNADAHEWMQWTPSATRQTVTVRELGAVEVHNAISSVIDDRVAYETHFHFENGGRLVATDQIRFLTQPEVDRWLNTAGLRALAWYGDWHRSELAASSPEIIVVAQHK